MQEQCGRRIWAQASNTTFLPLRLCSTQLSLSHCYFPIQPQYQKMSNMKKYWEWPKEKRLSFRNMLKIKQNKRTKKLAGTPLLPALWSALETRLVYSVSSRDIQGNPVSKNQKMKPKPNKSDQPTTTKTITACQSPCTPAHTHGLLDICIS